MDFLGGGLMDVSDSSSSSNSPAELQSELGPLRPTQPFYNSSVSHPQIFDMQYNYNISVPTLENQGVPSFGAFIDRMDESSHNDSEEHADSVSEDFRDDRRSLSSDYQSEGDDSSSAAPFEEAEKHTPIGLQYQVDLSVIDTAIEEDSIEGDEARGGCLVWDPTRADDPTVDAFLASTRLDGEWNFYDTQRDPLSPDHTQVAPVEMVMFALHRHNYDVTAATEELDSLGLKWHPCRPDLTHWSQPEIDIFEAAMDRVEVKEELNFAEIQRAVKTKNYHEIVEFYWYWKKALRRRPSLINMLLEEDAEDSLAGLERSKRKRSEMDGEVDWDLIRSLRPDSSSLQSRVPSSSSGGGGIMGNDDLINDRANSANDQDDMLSPPKRRKIGNVFDGGDMPPLFADSSSNSAMSSSHGLGAVSSAAMSSGDLSANDTRALDTCDLPEVYSLFDVESNGGLAK